MTDKSSHKSRNNDDSRKDSGASLQKDGTRSASEPAKQAAAAHCKENGIHTEWETPEFLMMQKRLAKTAAHMKLDANELEPLRHPKRAMMVVVPARMDNGTVRTFTGYRVHYDLTLGPGKGGIRFHPQVTLGEVASVAMLMTWKCSLMNLPFGGAHGGIQLDPDRYSQREIERVTRRYASEIIDLLGPDQDIPGPDLNTNEQTMSWIMDTYSVNVGHTVPSVVTGKPQSIGGSLAFIDALGYGVATCAKRAAKHLSLKGSRPTVVIQGLGNVGSVVARDLHEHGFNVVAVSDKTGGVYNKSGLDLSDLKEHITASGGVNGYQNADYVTNEQLLELDCDILAPCAVANQITAANATKIKATAIVEGANGPTTTEADDILDERGIMVIPDILAASAGVTVGYFEWVQGLMRLFWTDDEVYKRLENLMTRACDRVFETADRQSTSLRMAAWQLALERVIEARRLRGLYP